MPAIPTTAMLQTHEQPGLLRDGGVWAGTAPVVIF